MDGGQTEAAHKGLVLRGVVGASQIIAICECRKEGLALLMQPYFFFF